MGCGEAGGGAARLPQPRPAGRRGALRGPGRGSRQGGGSRRAWPARAAELVGGAGRALPVPPSPSALSRVSQRELSAGSCGEPPGGTGIGAGAGAVRRAGGLRAWCLEGASPRTRGRLLASCFSRKCFKNAVGWSVLSRLFFWWFP